MGRRITLTDREAEYIKAVLNNSKDYCVSAYKSEWLGNKAVDDLIEKCTSKNQEKNFPSDKETKSE